MSGRRKKWQPRDKVQYERQVMHRILRVRGKQQHEREAKLGQVESITRIRGGIGQEAKDRVSGKQATGQVGGNVNNEWGAK